MAISLTSFVARINRKVVLTLLLMSCGLLSARVAVGQMKLSGPGRVKSAPSTTTANKRVLPNNKKVYIDTLSLPFWDDFSVFIRDSLGRPMPDTLKWVSSQSVTINNSMAINPPSVYTATFDGLDSAFRPYEASQVFLNGLTDMMTSQPIDVGSITPDQVDSVYLSFFYQWKGNGEAPDNNDYLIVEYYHLKEKRWIEQGKVSPAADRDATKFLPASFKVDTTYQKKGFRFRITRFGKKSGPFDTWHLDYVMLRQYSSLNNLVSPDGALSTGTTHLFLEYETVPIRHFFAAKPKLDTIIVHARNHAADSILINLTPVNLGITTFHGTASTYDTTSLHPTFEKTRYGPDEFATGHINMNLLDQSLFDPTATFIDIKVMIDTHGSDSAIPGYAKFAPIDFGVNDTLSQHYTIGPHYAYDDGTAEYSVNLEGVGTIAAQKYDMLIPDDTVVAADIYFPDLGIFTNQSTTIYVFDDKNGLPGDPLAAASLTVTASQKNAFTHVEFPSSATVHNSFYIGWKEKSATSPVYVGLDKGNDQGTKLFENVYGLWQPVSRIHGNLMIRPLFGKSNKEVVSGVGEVPTVITSIYPNPSNGRFVVEGDIDELTVLSMTGQTVVHQVERDGDKHSVTVNATSGLYFLKCRSGNRIDTRKIVVK